MEINIVNKYTRKPNSNDVYIGRGSPLGNPHPITSINSRDRVCDSYAKHIKEPTPAMVNQMEDIIKIGRHFGSVNLVCFCVPLRCHGSSIKTAVEGMLMVEELSNAQG